MNTIISNNNWWQKGVIYQIYPKSFQSTKNVQANALAIGDLQGIIQRLDYLKTLGVDGIWITPIYPSPQVDNGYDIADYYDINPDYGTLDDFDELVTKAHQKGIKIMLDMVFNHTSDKHFWFQQALDPNSEYRDFYIWKNGKDNNQSPPNNWRSKFGGGAWKWHEVSKQYYLHLFSENQPDLNWENSKVRAEIVKVCQFWIKRGVDALRLDVINLISKQQDFLDDLQGDGRRFYTDGPRVHEYLQELSTKVFQPNQTVTVGEMSSTTLDNCVKYANLDGKELSMVFNFHHLKVDYPNGEKWCVAKPDFIELKKIFSYWQQGMHNKAWPALFWCNHDQPRIASRFGSEGQYHHVSATCWAMILYGMQGTPYIYQGEEIGMLNPHFDSIKQYRDIESLNFYHEKIEHGLSEKEILAILAQKSRDNSRTPMQWNDAAFAGFSQYTPWISVAKQYPSINVEKALADKSSIFYFYQMLIQLRKQYEILILGDYQDLLPASNDLWIYQRQYQHAILTVVANLTDKKQKMAHPIVIKETTKIVCHNYSHPIKEMLTELEPYQTLYLLNELD
ncbi:alpha,alpha-phosphotrehalase [Orbus mooreae]|uniref:alpha,alpha-phosphotrehalase n=1 Tax=Orbus mooreae TaxID=3074107 RepID=UPI00370D5C4F